MSTAVVGLATGMALGFAGYFGGFTAFLLVAALGAIGFVIGRTADGTVHWTQLARPSRDHGISRRGSRLK
ncbi:hypothetical protein [Streptomyces zagrosensis]|uniref:DUF2273 domain-containing protein n=1 Tax=Streptomyces zagrosensis TaxID=1042984 RepID=A0A7W9QE55_9ACTN|nr:hypothetical protein [Streptomyces zagrosensis]MBB5937357.1 hypothetical protein [Streptomyces zagrosensis]